MHARNGIVHAFCFVYPLCCTYHIIISQVYKSATLESAYYNLPTARNGNLDMNHVLSDFLLAGDSNFSPECMAGYCGEHISRLSYLRQGNIGMNIVTTENELGKCKRTCRALAPIAAPKLIQNPSPGATRMVKHAKREDDTGKKASTNDTLSEHKQHLLTSLSEGKGIDTDGFLELCTSCNQYFLSKYLRSHILTCPNE
ncbi:hypothetical protein BDQ17DRAFT_1494706 [Cyathus striatus]|nr:hypothetical protein BDQ17DRAFT_1494706 [Cyathus striatus]